MPTEEELRRANNRGDLIKRLFAVAISVGFAATLTQMTWIKNGTLPDSSEWIEIVGLITALIATLLSWDGYLSAIEDRPLTSFSRFGIDVLLVFLYMIMLITSKRANFLLALLAFVFVLYAIWNILTVRDYIEKYDPDANVVSPAPISAIFRVYVGGFTNRGGVRLSPVITSSWAVYFLALAVIARKHPGQIIPACAFALAGLAIHRFEHRAQKLGMLNRALMIVVLLIVALIYYKLYPWLDSVWGK